MRTFEKPVVVVSKCLEFAACRYDGQKIADMLVKNMREFVRFLPVCPEVEIGLGTPRETIKIVAAKGKKSLVQPSTGLDLTRKMLDFTTGHLDALDTVDGFLLKSRSPSCGLKDVKSYPTAEKSSGSGRGPGFFGEAVLSRYPHLAVEDEARLGNAEIRHHFLTKLFCIAEFRKVKKSGTMKGLVRFHASHKFLLMCYDQKHMRVLGRIASNLEKKPAAEVLEEYQIRLFAAFEKLPTQSNTVNAIQHIQGFFSKDLSAKEKTHFLALLEKYRKKKISIAILMGLLGSWVVRFDKAYLADQTIFEPYPEILMEGTQ